MFYAIVAIFILTQFQISVDPEKPPGVLRRHEFPVTCLCLSEDNLYVYSSAKDGAIVQSNSTLTD